MRKIRVILIDDSDWKRPYRSLEEFEVEGFSNEEIQERIRTAIQDEKEDNEEYSDESIFETIAGMEGFQRSGSDIDEFEFDY